MLIFRLKNCKKKKKKKNLSGRTRFNKIKNCKYWIHKNIDLKK